LTIVEASTFNRLDRGMVWVQLAIVIPELATRLRGVHVDLSRAKGFESGISTDLGQFFGETQRHWLVNVDDDNSLQGTQLRAAITEHGLPWFEKARTEDGLIDILRNDPSMDALEVRAILYSDRGDFDGVQSMLGEIVARRPDLDSHVREWAAERKLFRSNAL